MKHTELIKRTSLYIPLELVDKIRQSAMIHRRSFNQEILWLAEQGLYQEKSAHASVSSTCAKVATEDSLQLSFVEKDLG